MKVHIEKARRDHLPPILDDIRAADLREWAAGTGSADLVDGLDRVFQEDRYAKAACDESGMALCMWGVDNLPDGSGWVWLFATNRAVPLFLPIHRHLKSELGAILSRWPTLHAYSDARNLLHHRWLGWLGFTYGREVPLGPFGLPFKHYTKEALCASQH